MVCSFWAALCLAGSRAQAACTEIAGGSEIPETVKRNECFEIQSDCTLNHPLRIEGKLFIHAGNRVEIADGVRIDIGSRATLGVRGTLALNRNNEISVAEFGRLGCEGEILVKEARIFLHSRGSIESTGRIRLFPHAQMVMERDAQFRTGGITEMDEAEFKLQGAVLDNSGTLTMTRGSVMTLSANSALKNRGHITADADSVIETGDTGRITNQRIFSTAGALIMRQTSSLHNRYIFTVEENARMELRDGAFLNNQHIVNLSGILALYDHSRYDNLKNLQIGSHGLLRIRDNGVVSNSGTVYDRGKVLIERRGGLQNRNIFYINDLKQSHNVEELLMKGQPDGQ